MDSYITRVSKYAALVGITNAQDLIYGIRRASESTGETPEAIITRLERETTPETIPKDLMEALPKRTPVEVKVPLFMNRARRRKEAKRNKKRKVVESNVRLSRTDSV